jgi:primosomal protein N' (replication factor Y)
MAYVNVVIDSKSRYTDTFYTYSTDNDIPVGSVVKVPFNKGNKLKTAYVFETGVKTDLEPDRIKEVAEIDESISLSSEMIETCVWMRQRYGIRYIDAVKCFIPPGKPPKPGKEKTPYKNEDIPRDEPPELTGEQLAAADEIDEAIDSGRQENFLIHGVTSSGKTEVYMKAMAEALSQGKTAIMLLPEITLAEQIVTRFIARFGKEEVAVLHSRLTTRERHDEWMRLKTGKAHIAIGARIAVFAPLDNIGVVILDEEHESAYKSDQTPKYDTVDIAMKRLMHYSGVLILGSATPSVVSYERAREGIYKLITLKERYNKTPLPRVKIIDMKQELRNGNVSIFSSELYENIKRCLDEKKQIILFMNRRGYSTSVRCDDCGEAVKCPDCGITLVYHKKENALICHYCGRRFRKPDACPSCGSHELRYFGTGTEKVEDITREMFPEASVERLDLDTAKSKGETKRILKSFSKRKTDILIGTQLVAKGLDFDNVGLTGVISADTTLSIPDYRSTEKTFQLITQVAGRSGRGTEQGLVIVQTFTPDNFAVKAAAEHEYEGFFRQEIAMRKLMDYPPFTDLIACGFTAEDENKAYDAASMCRDYLIKAGLPNSERIFRPRLDYFFKGHNGYRYQIIIKCPKGERNRYIYYLRYFAGNNIENNSSGVVMVIDVNPYSSV